MMISGLLCARQRRVPGEIDQAVDHDVGDVDAMLRIFLGQTWATVRIITRG
jgi:hypothetical protein